MPPKVNKRSKTSRFPVARIKKIMQMDEEVGKLASATPVMISKSLECFLQLLIDETAKEARERGSRKMVPYHLKAMIDKSDQFDFLRELVEGIPDPVEPKSAARRKNTGGAAGEATGGAAGGRRRAAAQPKKEKDDVPPPGSLPAIGTWKRSPSGEGTGEGGKGMFDDYEAEDDNYDDW